MFCKRLNGKSQLRVYLGNVGTNNGLTEIQHGLLSN